MNASATSASKDTISLDDLRRDIEALRADVSKVTRGAAHSLAEEVGDAGRRIGQTGREARASVTDAVVDHPLAAVGIAAGLGFLLGMITRKG